MISLRELISSVQTRTTPCTWGQLQAWLTTELARIKQEGQIMINPPEVILPDGITTTSLVSQSEMTQFVTNTLNVWLGSIPKTPVDNLTSILYPDFYNVPFHPDGYEGGLTLGDPVDVRYFSNYAAIVNNLLNPGSYSIGELGQPLLTSSYKSGDTFNPAVASRMFNENFIPHVLDFSTGYGGFILTTEALEEDYSNLHTLLQNNTPVIFSFRPNRGINVISDTKKAATVTFFTAGAATTNKTKALVFLCYNDYYIPLFELDNGAAWTVTANYGFNIARVFDKRLEVTT